MYQALYRKWRPSTFDEVCGQEHITSVLKYEISSGAQSHAYLFSGSRGTGKTTCAKILAKAVNCLDPQNGNPCGKCEACRLVDSGEATDILEMDAASNTGVDYIRDIRDDVVYAPTALKSRVYIIDEVHMLSGGAFNALLKTLEEPPSHVVFVLATTEPHKIPATILSRCQHFEFRRIAAPVITERLAFISGEEGISVENDALQIIAKLSLGGMRDAVSLLELCAAGGEGRITAETVNRVAGVASRASLSDVARAVTECDYDKIFSCIEELHASSKDIGVFWQELLEFYRDLLIVKTASGAVSYLDLTGNELEELKALAPKYTKEQLLYHCGMLEKSFGDMQRYNSNKRIIAELTLVKMCDPALDDSGAAILARISALEDKMVLSTAYAASGIVPPQIQPAVQDSAEQPVQKEAAGNSANESIPTPRPETVVPKPAPEPSVVVAPDTPDVKQTPAVSSAPDGKTQLKTLGFWIEAVKKFMGDDPMTGSYLHESKAYADGSGKVYIKLKNAFGPVILDNQETRGKLASALITASGGSRVFRGDDLVFQKPDSKIDDDKFTYLDELADDFDSGVTNQ
nr:DNA polymerase III subunit gamma/tau [Clostridia bacterium]